MIVYTIQLNKMVWSSKKLWYGDFPDIYPSIEAAEKMLHSTPSKASKPIWNAEFYGYDVSKIEVVPYRFEKLL